MNKLAYRIRERRHHERTETKEWLILVGCLIGVALTVALAWSRDEKIGDCYYNDGRQVLIGNWKEVGDLQVCVRRN